MVVALYPKLDRHAKAKCQKYATMGLFVAGVFFVGYSENAEHLAVQQIDGKRVHEFNEAHADVRLDH